MVGLPLVAIRPNNTNAVGFMNKAYLDGIAHWSERAMNSPHDEIRHNVQRFSIFLAEDLVAFRQGLVIGRQPLR